MIEKETGFPYEASDSRKRGGFYPKSLRPDKPVEPTGFLADESADVGEPGDLGGGHNSLEDGSLEPSDIDPSLGPDWELTDQQRQTGLEGVKKAREALQNPPPPEENND